MKNRFVGKITVVFPDGYREQCLIKERKDKGANHFIDTVKENLTTILAAFPPKKEVKLTYSGDFFQELYSLFKDALEKE